MRPTHWRHDDPDTATALHTLVPSLMACDHCQREIQHTQVEILDRSERRFGRIVARLQCRRYGALPSRFEPVTGLVAMRRIVSVG